MVRRLLTEMYKNDPDGVIGNDDCGQMSAWFILSALGFYPVDPVSAIYVFGSPLFDVAEVTVGAGKTLTVRAEGNGPDRPYVQSVTWNGQPWSKNRSEEHTSELQSLMRISYAVFCLKKKINQKH